MMIWPRFLHDDELEQALQAVREAKDAGDTSPTLAADLAAIEEEHNLRQARGN